MQAFSGSGQFNAIRVAMKERYAKVLLQQLDLPTDRPVGDVQYVRRLGQAGMGSGFIKRLKRAKMSKIFSHVRKANSLIR